MATVTEESPLAPVAKAPAERGSVFDGEHRVALHGISWETYGRILDETGDGRQSLMAFNRGVLEIMSPGPSHEQEKGRLHGVASVVAEEHGVPCMAYGSTTWKNSEVERGIEADDCFYLTRDKIDSARKLKKQRCNDSASYPSPDLAIEIDISPSAVDRAGIYSALGVPEVWRFDGSRLAIDRLVDDGTYHSADASRFLPIRRDDVVRWVLEDAEDDGSWARAFRVWVREHLAEAPPRA